MPATQSDKLHLLYQGSVKRVFAADKQKDRLWFEFSDDYSVFDWGKMPDTIANKGRALTVLGAFFFEQMSKPAFWQTLKDSSALAKLDKSWLDGIWKSETYKQLCAKGAVHHFHRLTDGEGQQLNLQAAAASANAVYMEVARAAVFHPTPALVLGQPVYFYPPLTDTTVRRLVPLEVVFRFGMPAGSSLKERLERAPEYAQQLGLATTPSEGQFFDRCVIEYFTKLEPKDRLLTVSEALNMSTLTPQQFNRLSEMAVLGALALQAIFGERGVELWDGKFEFIFDGEQIAFADSIGPDELRLIYKGLQLSKEMIRQVYRGGAWEKALKEAQKLALQRGSLEWKAICKDELKSQPENLPAGFKAKIDQLYGVLTNHIVGQQLFAGQPDLESFAHALKAEKP